MDHEIAWAAEIAAQRQRIAALEAELAAAQAALEEIRGRRAASSERTLDAIFAAYDAATKGGLPDAPTE